MKLSILCPDGNLLYETEQDYIKAPEWQTLNWSIQNFNGCDVKTGNARYRVELLIKCSGGAQWATKGEIEYDTRNKWKTLSWTGIELPCDHCGNAEYMFRFVQGYVKSEIYTGPEIVVAGFGDTIVAPGNGTN